MVAWGGDQVQYREQRPCSRLAHAVQCYWELASPTDGRAHKILPNGCVELAFNLSDPISQVEPRLNVFGTSRAFIVGQQYRYHSFRTTERSIHLHVFGVRFQPAGALPLLRAKPPEIAGAAVVLHDVVGSVAGELEGRVFEAGSFSERVAALRSFLIRRLPPADRGADPRIEHAVRVLQDSAGTARIEALAREVNLGRRQLEVIFKDTVGLAPKFFGRVARIRRVLACLQSNPDAYGVDLILDHGYYDQSHFIREFQLFAGEAPRAFLSRPHRLNECFD